MRYLMTFSYDGNYFKGYQRQKDLKTVQGTIEKELTKINNGEVTIHASGRTDVGVHAIRQVAHFDFNKEISLDKLKDALNNKFEQEINIINIKKVPSTFHARYNCISKEYHYFINIGELNIFKKNYIYQYNKKIDIKLMKKAIAVIKGKHDFKEFCTDSKERDNFVRTISKAVINKNEDLIEIIIRGDGFLKHMVRNIVGILIEIGSGKKDINYLKSILDNDTTKIPTLKVPGCGLYLWDVYYK